MMSNDSNPENRTGKEQDGHAQRLVELIRYIVALQPQESHADRISDKDKLLDTGSMLDLPGISFPFQEGSGDAWVKLERVQPTAPPSVPDELKIWVVVEDHPGKPPSVPTLRKRIDNPEAIGSAKKPKNKTGTRKGDAGQEDVEGGPPTYLWLRNFPEVETSFNQWLVVWRAWADKEAPRRRSAATYERLYKIYRDLTTEGLADSREIVCGSAHAIWKHKGHTGGEKYSHPLILQRCEVRMLDDASSSLEIWPSNLSPTLQLGRLGAGHGGEAAEAFWKSKGHEEPISPFDVSSYAHLAAGLAARLDASGAFHESWVGKVLPEANERLSVIPWMSFFHKKRSHSNLLADLANLERAILLTDELPQILINLVDRDSVQALPENLPRFRGLENFGHETLSGNSKDLYFPLPYNEEQIQVAQRLEVSPGVVVQGPPGTGKSHTIANVVSHYLAEGKRVLVTAHSAAALAAVREKIPESIRDLTAALLTSDTDSLSDFEKSVREIADRLATYQPDVSHRIIEDLSNRVDGLYARQGEIDTILLEQMRPHHALHILDGNSATLMDIARFHIQPLEHNQSWWGRVPPARENPGTNGRIFPTVPQGLDKTLIQKLRQARLDAGSLFPKLFEPVSNAETWPDEEEIRGVIQSQRRLDELRRQAREGTSKSRSSPMDSNAAWELRGDLQDIEAHVMRLQKLQTQADSLDPRVRYPARPEEPILGDEKDSQEDAASNFCSQVVTLKEQLRQQLGRIQIHEEAIWNKDFRQAVERGAKGEPPLGSFIQKIRTDKTIKAWIDGAHIDGTKVTGRDNWILVQDHLKTLDRAEHIQDDWARFAVAFNWQEGTDASATGTSLVPVCEKPKTPEMIFRTVSEVASRAEMQRSRSTWRREISPGIEHTLGEIFVNPLATGQSEIVKSKWAREIGDKAIQLRSRGADMPKSEEKPRLTSPWAGWDQMPDGQRDLAVTIAEKSLNLWQEIDQEQRFLDQFKNQSRKLVEEARPLATLSTLPPLPVPPRTRQTVATRELTMMDRVINFLETEMWEEGPAPVSGLRSMRSLSGNFDSIEQRITKWRTLRAGMERLYMAVQLAAIPAQEGLNNLIEMGLGDWVHALIKQPLDNLPNAKRTSAALPDDPLLPDDWKERLTRAQVHAFLVDLDTSRALTNLLEERKTVVSSLSHQLRELVAERAWDGLSKGVSPRQRQALGAYLSAVRAVGSGTGKRSARHQQDARSAMSEAFSAVPCWIMPTARISETMPSEIGLFDLVIIDEASQSDISALPALMRGKKVLVVGDDKQVSPSNFVQEEAILQHRRTLLAHQPFAPLMAPDRSLYDLFSGILPNASIMLREHFRCVEPIISWSNRHYYHDKMIPLRMPAAAERLDPPLVDILVEDGKMEDDVNIPEAVVIAREIAKIVKNPEMANKTIGVVTLPSKETQSLKIKEHIDQAIPHTAYLHHKILVGPPARFQGSERDIMFVAMTWDGSAGGASDRPEFHQRFNVAMSRARDRMILVRSVPDSMVRGGTLMANVIHHFQEGSSGPGRENYGRERCQTDLEREVFDALNEGGYNVHAQVGPKHARIDLVVEDTKGNRLAIECDGDLPATSLGLGEGWTSLWSATTARQRVLERAGWAFFRIAAAGWYLDREGTLGKIKAALLDAGVEPKNGRWKAPSSYIDVAKIVTRSQALINQLNAPSTPGSSTPEEQNSPAKTSRFSRRVIVGGDGSTQ